MRRPPKTFGMPVKQSSHTGAVDSVNNVNVVRRSTIPEDDVLVHRLRCV